MKIAFNALNARTGSGITVLQTLLPAIVKYDRKNSYFIFVSENQEDIIEIIPPEYHKIIFKNVPLNPYLRVLWEQLFLPFYIWKLKIDILYSGGNITILFAPCKKLLFIENTNPFSNFLSKWSLKEKIRIKLLKWLGFLSALRADKIRFCSLRSKEIISKIYKINDKKCFVLYHGLDLNNLDNMDIADNNIKNLGYNYILTVSVIAPHKNIELLIMAFKKLTENGYDGKLLIIGNERVYPEYYSKLKKLVYDISLLDFVIFTGEVPYRDISLYYKNADIFIFPSLEETFGLPLIEALYYNIPVLASDGNKYRNLFIPFNELVGDIIEYFDPFSVNDLYEKASVILKKRNIYKNDYRKFIQKKYSIENISKELIKRFSELE